MDRMPRFPNADEPRQLAALRTIAASVGDVFVSEVAEPDRCVHAEVSSD